MANRSIFTPWACAKFFKWTHVKKKINKSTLMPSSVWESWSQATTVKSHTRVILKSHCRNTFHKNEQPPPKITKTKLKPKRRKNPSCRLCSEAPGEHSKPVTKNELRANWVPRPRSEPCRKRYWYSMGRKQPGVGRNQTVFLRPVFDFSDKTSTTRKEKKICSLLSLIITMK